jgi:hypothetical protein
LPRTEITSPKLPAPMGGDLQDIVKVTVFIRDIGLYDRIHEVRRRYFEKPYPASSMVEVSALIDPRLLIEIEAVALVEQERRAGAMGLHAFAYCADNQVA